MFRRRSIQTVVAISCILLVLGASVPEVVCCCDISWGPGGLLGSSGECVMDCCHRATAAASCCCHQSTCEFDNGPFQAIDAGAGCKCSFSLVPPAPMTGSDAVSVDTGHAKLLGTLATFFNSRELVAIWDAEAPHSVGEPHILTPGSRCALLQSWRA